MIVVLTWLLFCLLLILLLRLNHKYFSICGQCAYIEDKPLIARIDSNTYALTKEEKLNYRSIQELK